ncbi:hypothetical protein HSBAA_29930 [Vreelandella sulfidaeris]|uniref:Uncharacterized protein n=1 Tax=Vreelandella sulfidaeris TaxID=115553 RepID=A0A455U832_9GAMM|nr:hypothetical protein HSBAA_29930 [Halomonas sulfidaeris]
MGGSACNVGHRRVHPGRDRREIRRGQGNVVTSVRKRRREEGQSAIDKKVEAEIIEKATKNVDKWAERSEQARESYFKSLEMLHKLTVATIGKAHQDKKLFSAQADLKAIQMAAIAIDKIRSNQWSVLGLDKQGIEDEEIPELLVRSLTPDEVAKIRESQLKSNNLDDEIEIGDAAQYLEDPELDLEEDLDDLVVEGEED